MINRIVGPIIAIILAASLWSGCNKVPHGDENYLNSTRKLKYPIDTLNGFVFSSRISVSKPNSEHSISSGIEDSISTFDGYMDIFIASDNYGHHDTTLSIVIDSVILQFPKSGPKLNLLGDSSIVIPAALLPIHLPFQAVYITDVQLMPILSYAISIIDPKNNREISWESFKHRLMISGNEYVCEPHYPNPFSPRNEIQYHLMDTCDVAISIYNIDGDLVDTLFIGDQSPGHYVRGWDVSDLPSGVYFYKIEACGDSLIKKAMLLR